MSFSERIEFVVAACGTLCLFVRLLVLSVFAIGGGIALICLCGRIAIGCFGLLFE